MVNTMDSQPASQDLAPPTLPSHNLVIQPNERHIATTNGMSLVCMLTREVQKREFIILSHKLKAHYVSKERFLSSKIHGSTGATSETAEYIELMLYHQSQ